MGSHLLYTATARIPMAALGASYLPDPFLPLPLPLFARDLCVCGKGLGPRLGYAFMPIYGESVIDAGYDSLKRDGLFSSHYRLPNLLHSTNLCISSSTSHYHIDHIYQIMDYQIFTTQLGLSI